ncbi:MAG: hypothetical protein R3B70_26650 [Polyangiaceae bacterium]
MLLSRAAAAAVLLTAATAPYQCAREPDPNRRIEDDPAEAIQKLADRLKSQGDTEGQVTALKFLIERYPTSRYAKAARLELEQMGQSVPPPPPED